MRLPPLHELSLWQRIVLALGIVLFAVLLLLLISWFANAQPMARDEPLYKDISPDSTLLLLDKRALSEAYEEQIRHLFAIWVKGQAKSTKEISSGIRIAREAYNSANAQIAKREQEQAK
jgi:hypothetical protein